MLDGPGVTVMMSSVASSVALPLESAFSAGMSPAWRSGLPGLPCGLPKGLKCPLVLMPSPELQSPASWIWKPCSWPGTSPLTLPVTRTTSPTCVKLTVPPALLPLVGSTFAVALGAWEGTLWQSASAAAATMSSMVFMGGLLLLHVHRDALVLLVVG